MFVVDTNILVYAADADDLHTAVLMREHGIRSIRTRDTHLHRFEFVEVVDPVA